MQHRDIENKIVERERPLYTLPFFTEIFNAVLDWARYPITGPLWSITQFASEWQLQVVYGREALRNGMEAYFREHPHWLPFRAGGLERVRRMWSSEGRVQIMTEEERIFPIAESLQLMETTRPEIIAEVVRLEQEVVPVEKQRQQVHLLMRNAGQYFSQTREFRNLLASTSQMHIETEGGVRLNPTIEALWHHLEKTESMITALGEVDYTRI